MYSSTSYIYKVSAWHNARQGRDSINLPLGHSLTLQFIIWLLDLERILRVVTGLGPENGTQVTDEEIVRYLWGLAV